MKSFYTPSRTAVIEPVNPIVSRADSDEVADSDRSITRNLTARLAVYDSAAAAPRVDDIASASPESLIEELTNRVYSTAQELGGEIPYTVVREVVENLIHANFQETVVSVLDRGNTLRFADQGPGIQDKERALLPGFTTATKEMKHYIRGVGSGLPIVREFLTHQGGSLQIDDNLGRGTVVTLSVEALSSPGSAAPVLPLKTPTLPAPHLTTRQKRVLSLVMEFGEAGPTLVSKELAVGLSTAYRDLAFLEEVGLIAADESGKRILTEEGSVYLDSLFA